MTNGEIAQLVERRTHKPKVKGSIPFLATTSPRCNLLMLDRDKTLFQPRDKFGSFEVIKLLGKGGMCEVYLVGKKFSLERYAVKILNPEIAERDHANVDRFIREAEFAMQSRHPNLIEVYDVGRDPETGYCYITMEYLQGGSLKDLLAADGVMSFPGITTIATDIARALAYVESKGMVHRDVKPDNILFSSDGSAKLADLGVLRFANAQSPSSGSPEERSDRIIGTPAYMAPEQMFDSAHVDSRADIYSLGVVMYEMIAGRRPNEGDNAMSRLAKAIGGITFPDVRKYRPDAPPYLASLVCWMTRPNVEERPGSVRNVIEQLRHPERVRLVEFVPDEPAPEDAAPDQGCPWYRDRGVMYALTATILAVETLVVTIISVLRRI